MLIRKPSDIRPSEITSRDVYMNRRSFLASSIAAGGTLAASLRGASAATLPEGPRAVLSGVAPSRYSTDEPANSYADITSYNNYYEFGTGKEDPQANAQSFEPRPWTIEVSGNAQKTGTFDIEDIVRPHQLQERIYRLRCVERWSMVIPWVGIPLADVVKSFKPLSSARYVKFETLHDSRRMPGQRSWMLDWPYVEGLTIEEATNPLPILAVGLYGEVLPNQNGAPIRLVVPWKYGFKSIKGIVKIHFTDKRPRSSWEKAGPNEYGFYANVNPQVAHPRWSQARERRIGGGSGLDAILGNNLQDTVLFNGYGEQVAHLYSDLDLRKNF